MFGSVEPTAYDLRFAVAGMPVRVSVFFWLLSAFLGYRFVHEGIQYLLAWMLVVFISILVHELGHALAARACGYPPRIVLHQMGGVTLYEPYHNYTRKRAIAITAAGPAAGIALWLFTLATTLFVYPLIGGALPKGVNDILAFMLSSLLWVNLVWTVLNLLPVLPLDGGQICRDLLSAWRPRQAVWYTAQLGTGIAALAAILFFQWGMLFAALLFALLCAQNFSMMQQANR